MDLLQQGFRQLLQWQAQWAPFEAAPDLHIDPDTQQRVLTHLVERLHDNYPFFHPHYAGQMLKPPHPIAAMAYTLAMQINPNNHALDGGPATARMEKEVITQLAQMFGYEEPLGHLTSSGTIANLEALWVARSLHPGKMIAYSEQSHYTHARMCQVLGVEGVAVPCDQLGRLDLKALEDALYKHAIGTVVATAGTTGLGALDPIDRLVELGGSLGFRVHVDAAYGGFFRLLAPLDQVDRRVFEAIQAADSVVIDPHKHGLQPYGCGAVLFRDASVGRFYHHDSPYTYFTSDELHLGEISLECSRAGAAAAALWATLQCFPLLADQGLGKVLQATRRAAQAGAALLRASNDLNLVMDPQLDILAYYPKGQSASAISRTTQTVFQHLMSRPDNPIYLATLKLPRHLVSDPGLIWDQDHLLVFRSVLMKPEHEKAICGLLKQVESAVRRLAVG